MTNFFLKGLITSFALIVSGLANAGLIYNIENGNLVSANGVQLNGVEYNVFFGDSCSSMYEGCDQSLFTFNTQSEATAALDALFAQVLVDNVVLGGVEYDFLSKPIDIFSCNWGAGGSSSTNFCELWVPYLVNGQSVTSAWYSHRDGARVSTVPSWTGSINYGDNADYMAFTRWEVAQEVPEPTTLVIFALGLMGLASRKFKK
ncbi:PEP-CTERM sorting domain-containing protein [Colwellia sp. RSH04]|uniref:PEP-CTERM sorting domain-containing protein n=1 Tax=Colwellia sp. RSH04 TaxID=2305464 RepID=UPI002174FC28|nr:PEP-CTERM sorting domain-containing protein [Colwellia sp. RSH04]